MTKLNKRFRGQQITTLLWTRMNDVTWCSILYWDNNLCHELKMREKALFRFL